MISWSRRHRKAKRPVGAPRIKARSWSDLEGQDSLRMVMADGFAYGGQTFASLSEIATDITGTNWNGPRFLALRDVTAQVRATTIRKVCAQ